MHAGLRGRSCSHLAKSKRYVGFSHVPRIGLPLGCLSMDLTKFRFILILLDAQAWPVY